MGILLHCVVFYVSVVVAPSKKNNLINKKIRWERNIIKIILFLINLSVHIRIHNHNLNLIKPPLRKKKRRILIGNNQPQVSIFCLWAKDLLPKLEMKSHTSKNLLKSTNILRILIKIQHYLKILVLKNLSALLSWRKKVNYTILKRVTFLNWYFI